MKHDWPDVEKRLRAAKQNNPKLTNKTWLDKAGISQSQYYTALNRRRKTKVKTKAKRKAKVFAETVTIQAPGNNDQRLMIIASDPPVIIGRHDEALTLYRMMQEGRA